MSLEENMDEVNRNSRVDVVFATRPLPRMRLQEFALGSLVRYPDSNPEVSDTGPFVVATPSQRSARIVNIRTGCVVEPFDDTEFVPVDATLTIRGWA